MNAVARPTSHAYFPAIVCGEHDSPIDALVALCVPRAEALDLVAASWWTGEASCLTATLDGGRTVAVLRTLEGRWAACHAFFGDLSTTPEGAAQRLKKRLKPWRRGYVACLPRRG
ncbi:hypothetical protein [Accumulibacter sp.]|uniref:hypothetical protein n=1 Tax=Accumulibacter sp. TaxID=2053492 RepID=UPI00262C39EA|nr:hypothetical protein [Accumulibacter sp.]